MARAWIGTSGFSYKEWRPSFYPEDLSEKSFLSFYASRFSSVEIDYTFYRMPNAKTIEGWKAATGENFRFAIKASQKITHRERLKTPSEALTYLVGIVSHLESRLGVLLFQLPPYFRSDSQKLESFLAALPPDLPRAFEFRHDSWFTDETYQLLRDHNAGLCIHDADDHTTPVLLTAKLAYVRLRRSNYTPEGLGEWRERIRGWVEEGIDVFAYIKHEGNPDAPRIALELSQGLS